MFNNVFISGCLSSSACKHQVLQVLECMTVLDKNNVIPPKFAVVYSDLTQDPTTIVASELAPYRRSMVSSSGWRNLHDFMYVKKRDTDDLGWQYRSSWPTKLDDLSIDEPWSEKFIPGKHFVRRRLWITTNVAENDFSKAKKDLSNKIREYNDGAVLSIGKIQKQEKGLLGMAWKERIIVLKHNELEFLDVKTNKKVSSISLIGCEPVVCGSIKDVLFGLMIKQNDGTMVLIDAIDSEKRNLWELLINYQISLLSDSLNFSSSFGGPEVNINFSNKIVYSGLLHKEGHNVKNWKLRFCKLTAFDMKYYDGIELKGSIDVLGSTLEEGKEGSFEFSIKDKANKILRMKADSADKAEKWKREIQRCASGNFIKEEEKIRVLKEDEEEHDYLAKKEEKLSSSKKKALSTINGVNPLAKLSRRSPDSVKNETDTGKFDENDDETTGFEDSERMSTVERLSVKEAFNEIYGSDEESKDIELDVGTETQLTPQNTTVPFHSLTTIIVEAATEVTANDSSSIQPVQKEMTLTIPATVTADIFFKKNKFLREDTDDDVIPQINFSQASLPKPAAATKSRVSFYSEPEAETSLENQVEVISPPVPSRRQSTIKIHKQLPPNGQEIPMEGSQKRQSVFKPEKPLPITNEGSLRRQSVLKAAKPLPVEVHGSSASRRQSVLKAEKPLPVEVETTMSSVNEKPSSIVQSAPKPEKRLSVVKPVKRVSLAMFSSRSDDNEPKENTEIQSKEMILDLIEKNKNLALLLKQEFSTLSKPEKRPSMANVDNNITKQKERLESAAIVKEDDTEADEDDNTEVSALVSTVPFSNKAFDESNAYFYQEIEDNLRNTIAEKRRRDSIMTTVVEEEISPMLVTVPEAVVEEEVSPTLAEAVVEEEVSPMLVTVPEAVAEEEVSPMTLPRKSLNKLFGSVKDDPETITNTTIVHEPASYSSPDRKSIRRKSSSVLNSVPAATENEEVDLLKQMFDLNMSKLESQMSSNFTDSESQLLLERDANDQVKAQVESLVGNPLTQEQFNKFAEDYQESLKSNASENLISYIDDFKNDTNNNLDKLVNGSAFKDLGAPSPSPSQANHPNLDPQIQQPKSTRRSLDEFVDAWSESSANKAPSPEVEKKSPHQLFQIAAKDVVASTRRSSAVSVAEFVRGTTPAKRVSMAYISDLAKPKIVATKHPNSEKKAKTDVKVPISKYSNVSTTTESKPVRKASIAYIAELAKPKSSAIPKTGTNPRRRLSSLYQEQLSKNKVKEVLKLSIDRTVKADVRPIIEGFEMAVAVQSSSRNSFTMPSPRQSLTMTPPRTSGDGL